MLLLLLLTSDSPFTFSCRPLHFSESKFKIQNFLVFLCDISVATLFYFSQFFLTQLKAE